MEKQTNKLKIGIDIDEVLRGKWLQFDRYYVNEFGEDGAPDDDIYVFDYFNNYKFEDTVEKHRDLKEPEDMPEDINPLEYQVDENGEAPADHFILKPEEEIKLTAKEVYNRFMYEDYCFEIHGAAPMLYKGLDYDLNQFYHKYKDNVEFIIISKENYFSIPPTLFFLSKIGVRFKQIRFVDKTLDKLNGLDVLITTDPEILEFENPKETKIIKLSRPFNAMINNNTQIIECLQLKELNDDDVFNDLVSYKNKIDNGEKIKNDE